MGHSRANLTEVALPAKASIEMKSRNLVRCKDCLLDFEDGILEEVEMKLMLLCVELLVVLAGKPTFENQQHHNPIRGACALLVLCSHAWTCQISKDLL